MNSNWSYSPETVGLWPLWPWPFAWWLSWSLVITPENFMMILWWEHSQKGVTDRQTDRQTDGQTENTIHRAAWSQLKLGHLFYTTSSFVHHFKTIGKFKQELQSGNAQFGSKSVNFFLSRVTLEFDGWPWKTIGHLFYNMSSLVHHFKDMGEFKMELQSGNAQFRSNRWFFFSCDLEFWLDSQSGNTQFASKSAIFCPVWPWDLTDDIEKQ